MATIPGYEGRAGRYQNDGTFGYLKNAGNLDPLIVQSVENHNFGDIQKIYWRNSNINFSSVDSVIESFKEFPVKNIVIQRKNDAFYEPFLITIRNWLHGRIQREIFFKHFYYKAIRNTNPDIVHIHFGFPGIHNRKLKIENTIQL